MQQRDQTGTVSTTIAATWSSPNDAAAQQGRAISLSGSTSSAAAVPRDPIVAARRWLEHPERGGRLHPVLRERASSAVEVAEAHVLRLDECASRLAAEFEAHGTMNPELVAMVNDHAETLERFSTRLRTLIDPDVVVVDAADRIERGLAAAGSGGLDALADAL